ncbi:hypothetical protein [Robertmurraya andreesenii]|uniref:Phosphatase n=1 Tax=Anoxybacillus andreesenii TaxID=1325932 RepID=A0ABT9UYN9_9BACL|nr:hypothetical protein [Robertmurraya andreesenii]MDQ0153809.1 hypothetical protein [Robertmurraya andreesenii]
MKKVMKIITVWTVCISTLWAGIAFNELGELTINHSHTEIKPFDLPDRH